LRGIAKLSDRLIILLDLHRLLSLKAIALDLKRMPDGTVQGLPGDKKDEKSGKWNGSKEYALVN
jgi:hypothetical protein